MTASGDRMPAGPLASTVAHLGHALRPADPRPDADLVAAYARTRCELAAAELVRRHGPAVYGTCRRIHPPDADDAFQAVWLVFSRKAGRIRPPGMVAAWLHGVAVKVATKARTQSYTRRRRLMSAAKPDHTTDPPPADPLLQAVLDEELNRLPEPLRRAVLLCDLGGKTRAEAARELGWPEGTVATRLARGRAKLADRLRRRGVTLPAAGLAAALAPAATAAPVPPVLGLAAVRVLLGTATVPPAALPLADAAGSTMTPATWKLAALGVLAAVGLTAGGVSLGPPADPKPDRPADAPAAGEWTLKAVLTDHGRRVDGAAFAPDGKTFTTLGADGTAVVWDAATLAKKHTVDVWAGGPRPKMSGAAARPPGAAMQAWQTIRPRPDGKLTVFGHRTGGDLYAVLDPAAGKRTGHDIGLRPQHWLTVPRVADPPGTRQVELQRPHDFSGRKLLALPWLVTVSPDGQRAAVAELLDPPHDGHTGAIGVCDTATGKSLATLLCRRDMPRAVAWSPDGKRLAAGGTGLLSVFDMERLQSLWSFHSPEMTVTALGYTADNSRLLVGGRRQGDTGVVPFAFVMRADGSPAENFKAVQALPGHPTAAVSDWAVSPDGNTLVAAFGDRDGPDAGEVRVYVRAEAPPLPPPDEWRLKSVLKDHGQMVYDAAFSPDGRTLATAGADGTVIVRDAATLAVRSKIEVVKNLPPPGPAEVPAFDPVAKPLKPRRIGTDPRDPGSPPPGLGVRFAADGQLRVSYTTTGDGRPEHAGFDPATGKRVSTGVREDDLADVLHRAEGVFVQRPRGAEVKLDTPGRAGDVPAFDGIHVTLVSPDGKLAALTQWDPQRGGRLRVYDAATGKLLVERPLFPAADGGPTQAAFSPDGRRLAVGTMTGRLACFTGPDWAEAFRHDDPLTRRIDALAFTADGKQLLVAGYREEHERGWLGRLRSNTTHREVWVRDAATGEPVQALPVRPPSAVTRDNLKLVAGLGLPVSRLAVSPDGRALAVTLGSPRQGWPATSAGEQAAAAAAGEVRVYVRGEPQAPPQADPPANPDKPAGPARAALDSGAALKDHRQMVYDAAFSPDGRQFASIGADGTVIVRDTATLKPLHTFEVVKNLPPEPTQLTAPLQNPPDLRLWWRAGGFRGLRVRYRDGQGDAWAYFDPDGGRQAGGQVPNGATAHSDGERLIVRVGDRYAVTRLTGGGLPVPLALGANLTGLPAAAFAADGSRVAVVELHPDLSTRLRVCDAATGKALADRPVGGPKGPPPVALAFAPDGRRLACGLPDGTLVAWDGDAWAERYRRPPGEHGGPTTALAFAADGKQVYEAGFYAQRDSIAFGLIPTGTSTHRELRVWDAATGRWRMSTLTHLSHLRAANTADADRSPVIDRLVVSPDGRTLLAPQGSAARGSNTQTVAGQRAKATLAELLVYRRTAD